MPTLPRPSTAPATTGYRATRTLGKYIHNKGILRNVIRRTMSNAMKNINKTLKNTTRRMRRSYRRDF